MQRSLRIGASRKRDAPKLRMTKNGGGLLRYLTSRLVRVRVCRI
jgi:hypothetical protein